MSLDKEFILKMAHTFNYNFSLMKNCTFENEYGKWNVSVERLDYEDPRINFQGFIELEPLRKIDLEKLEMSVTFTDITNTSINFCSVTRYDPKDAKFYFDVYAFFFGSDKIPSDSFEVEIYVDASNCSELLEAKGIIDYNKELFLSGRLADVTIKTEEDGREIKAHNYILSRSKVFDAMLNAHDTKEAQEKTLKIDDISYEVLNEMIYFMYHEEAPKIDEMAIDLLMAADKYDIPGLVNKCIGHLSDDINMENFSKILTAADRMKIKFLKDAVIEFIIENREDICKTESWDQLAMDNMDLSFEIIDKFVDA